MVQFASYLRNVLCKTRLIFPCINGPNMVYYLVNLRSYSNLTTQRITNFFLHHKISAAGDIVLDVDAETGREVLVWTAERESKTRKGLEDGHQRQFCPKAFATGTNRCPVLYYKLFKARRPQKANSPKLPFYLAVNH